MLAAVKFAIAAVSGVGSEAVALVLVVLVVTCAEQCARQLRPTTASNAIAIPRRILKARFNFQLRCNVNSFSVMI